MRAASSLSAKRAGSFSSFSAHCFEQSLKVRTFRGHGRQVLGQRLARHDAGVERVAVGHLVLGLGSLLGLFVLLVPALGLGILGDQRGQEHRRQDKRHQSHLHTSQSLRKQKRTNHQDHAVASRSARRWA
jgi:hypothetical protein